MGFTSVAITGTVTLSNATPASGAVVSLLLNTPITDGTQIVAPEAVSTRCASDGTFSVTVNANDDTTTLPTGSYYEVTITYGSATLDTFNVIVPKASAPTVNLFTLAQLTNPNVATPYVSSFNGRNGTIVPQSGDYNATQISPEVAVVSQSATPAIDTDNGNLFVITGLAQAITSMTTNLTGTPIQGQFIWVKIVDNGTPRAIAWGSKFASTAAVTLPTTTVANQPLWVGFTWDSVNSVWDAVAGGGGGGGGITATSPDGSVIIGGTSTAPTFEAPLGAWLPSDNGLVAATFDPAIAQGASAPTKGTLYLARLSIHANVTITNLLVGMSTAGSGTSTGTFVGLYNSSGTLLTGSSDLASSFTGATGNLTLALTTPQALTAGTFVWAAILTNLATTQPTMRTCGNGTFAAFAGQTASVARFAINGTSITSLPGTITPSSNSVNQTGWWVGAS